MVILDDMAYDVTDRLRSGSIWLSSAVVLNVGWLGWNGYDPEWWLGVMISWRVSQMPKTKGRGNRVASSNRKPQAKTQELE